LGSMIHYHIYILIQRIKNMHLHANNRIITTMFTTMFTNKPILCTQTFFVKESHFLIFFNGTLFWRDF